MLRIDRKSFIEHLKLVTKVVAGNASIIPTVMNVLLDYDSKTKRLNIFGTNFEVSVYDHVDVIDIKEGTTFIPVATNPNTLLTLLTKLETEDVVIGFKKEDVLQLVAGKNTYKLPYLKKDDYIEVPELPSTYEFSMKMEELKKAVDKTSFAVSNEPLKVALSGQNFEITKEKEFRLVATDGYKLAFFHVPLPYIDKKAKSSIYNVVIPVKCVEILGTIDRDDVSISCDDKRIAFKFSGDLVISSQLIDGKFPEYSRIIPNSAATVLNVKKDELAKSLDRIMIFVNPNTKVAKISIGKKEMVIEASNNTSGDANEVISGISVNGNLPIELSFNAMILLQIVRKVEGEYVAIKINDPMSAVVIVGTDKDGKEYDPLLYIAMPLRSR